MGIFKLNGIDYMGGGGGGNTNYEELTQLEYDALTEEEKNNGTIYFITDANSNQDGKFQPIIYSKDEREIGVWTDGKPLYQKTLHFTTTSSTNTYTHVPHNISNADTIFIHDAFVQNSSTSFILSGYKGDAAANEIIVLLNHIDNTFDYKCGASAINSDACITLQYTKTTDSPGSGQWTPQGVPAHHYSTEEQIVGTWVDGSTMYEKTYVGTIGNYDSSIDGYLISADIDVTIIKELINIDGSLKSIDTAPAFASLNGLKNTSNWSADIHINQYGILLWAGNSSYGSKFAGGKAVVTIRYTKSS